MSFERIGDVLGNKDLDRPDDLLAFFELVRSVIRRRAGVELESVGYKQDIVRLTVSHPAEASEIRLRHIQIERELAKRSGRTISRLQIKILA